MAAIVMRKALGTPPPTSDAAWIYTPDILVYPFNQPSDTSVFTALYGTPFAQAPAPNAANYVFVRGQNMNTGAQNATVYLFSAENNPLLGIFNPLLNPANWQSNVFTVNSQAKNSVAMQASAQNQVVLGASALVWKPSPLTQSGSHYCLIAWIDNTGSDPPPFATLKKFSNYDAVRTYVEAHDEMTMLDTAYSGMFMRQYLEQSYNQAAPTSTPWNAAPDFALFAGQQPFDNTLLGSATDWVFQQMPLTTGQNFLYVRGVNSFNDSLKSRLTFFYAENNPAAASNPLLTPANWKTDAFTYQNNKQNFFDVSAQASADPMTNSDALIWTPPLPTSGGHYCVIAWIDNTDGNNPPPFASLPAFTSLDTLATYVEGQRNIAFWDSTYKNLFMRQFVGQTVAQPGTGALTSPDIVITGAQPVQDASSFVTQTSYNAAALNQAVVLQQRNFIYLRAINPNNTLQSARVYLYSASDSTDGSLSPPSWSTSGFSVAGKQQNWIDLKADGTLNQVLVSTIPIVWDTPDLPSNVHYVLIAYIDGSASPQPPDFSPFGYAHNTAVTQLVALLPQVTWLQLTSSEPNPKPSMSADYSLTTTTALAEFVGVQLINIPADGKLSVFVPGPDSANTLIKPKMNIPDPNAYIVWPVSYPADFQSSLVVNYYQGASPPPQGASVVLAKLPKPSS